MRSGTTTMRSTMLPPPLPWAAVHRAYSGCTRTASSIAAVSEPAGTSIRNRVRPFTWTGTVTTPAWAIAGSASGNGS